MASRSRSYRGANSIACGLEAALQSYRQGRTISAARAREIVDAALGR